MVLDVRVKTETKVLKRISQKDLGLIVSDFALLTGCTIPDVAVHEDGTIVISCSHGHHPEIEAEKRMAS